MTSVRIEWFRKKIENPKRSRIRLVGTSTEWSNIRLSFVSCRGLEQKASHSARVIRRETRQTLLQPNVWIVSKATIHGCIQVFFIYTIYNTDGKIRHHFLRIDQIGRCPLPPFHLHRSGSSAALRGCSGCFRCRRILLPPHGAWRRRPWNRRVMWQDADVTSVGSRSRRLSVQQA